VLLFTIKAVRQEGPEASPAQNIEVDLHQNILLLNWLRKLTLQPTTSQSGLKFLVSEVISRHVKATLFLRCWMIIFPKGE
jgi:hypothetical protein